MKLMLEGSTYMTRAIYPVESRSKQTVRFANYLTVRTKAQAREERSEKPGQLHDEKKSK